MTLRFIHSFIHSFISIQP